MAAVPTADTWVYFSCKIMYSTAAITTGLTAGVWANNAGATAAPQYFNARFRFGGFAAAGTDSTWEAYTTAHGAVVTTTGVVAANTWYLLEIDALILTHLTDANFLIWPTVRSEVNLSAINIKEGSHCGVAVLHVDS